MAAEICQIKQICQKEKTFCYVAYTSYFYFQDTTLPTLLARQPQEQTSPPVLRTDPPMGAVGRAGRKRTRQGRKEIIY